MAQDQPKPFLVRFLLFVVGGYCALAIVTVAILLPLLMVANWGGGPSQSLGWAEVLIGMGVAAAGFGVPSLVFSKSARTLKVMVPVGVLVGGALLLPFLRPPMDREAVVVIIVLGVLHGLAMFWAFGKLSGRTPPPEWKDMP